MPLVRATGRLRFQTRRVLAALPVAAMLPSGAAHAQGGFELPPLSTHDVVLLTVVSGIALFAVFATMLLIRQRQKSEAIIATQRADLGRVRQIAERNQLLLFSDPQIVVSWGNDPEPTIEGDISIVISAPVPRRVLAFGTWLDPEPAQDLEKAIEQLRATGERFERKLITLHGRHIEAIGRPIGGVAVLWLRDMTGVRRELSTLAEEHRRFTEDVAAMRGLVDALPAPIWMRDHRGKLVFVNPAYARAVDAKAPEDAVGRGLELLDKATREQAFGLRASGLMFRERMPVVAAGSRKPFDVFDVPAARGASAGIALDATLEEGARADLKRAIEAHRGVLDQLPTAVAIFAQNSRLTFYNAAYRALWDLDAGFLDSGPTDSVVLDQLRAAGKLPEPSNWKEWKRELHECYRAPEPRVQEPDWVLPDGRTVRVVTAPDSTGGVIYLFDDITRSIDLERRYEAQMRVQGETLAHLEDGVAVFGSDGRLKFSNPRFQALWSLADSDLAGQPHVEMLTVAMSAQCNRPPLWAQLRGIVAGLDRAETFHARLELTNGTILDATAAPLADGQTLVVFHDITSTVQIETRLREGNEALLLATRIKNDFVHHVSYTLRTPLTSIIGFAQLLDSGVAGAPTPRQREYLGHITGSSGSLLAIIDNILNLASIDTDSTDPDPVPVRPREAIEEAIAGLADRIAQEDIAVEIDTPADMQTWRLDRAQVVQVLFNLIDNAVTHSARGSRVAVTARPNGPGLDLIVADEGRGIPKDMLDHVFDRFVTRPHGEGRRGAGLGLSIVRAFVELHGGSVRIESEPGQGTRVTCHFPGDTATKTAIEALRARRADRDAAE